MRLGSRAWLSMRYRTAGDRGRVLEEGGGGEGGEGGEEEDGECGEEGITHTYIQVLLYTSYMYIL